MKRNTFLKAMLKSWLQAAKKDFKQNSKFFVKIQRCESNKWEQRT